MDRFETHTHSYYSNIRLTDCINSPKQILQQCIKYGLKGVCLTDHETLSGHVEFLKAAKELRESKEMPNDFKIGLGDEIYLIKERSTESQKYYHFILIAKDKVGHKQLREISSTAALNGYTTRKVERVPITYAELSAIVSRDKGHLIATTACIGGMLGSSILKMHDSEKYGREDEIKNVKIDVDNFLKYCINLFGNDFYIETAPSASDAQIIVNKRLKSIANFYNIKMTVATDAHYLCAEDRELHKAYLQSKEEEREVDMFYYYSHLMDNKELSKTLKESDFIDSDISNFCANSMDIYNKIEQYDLAHSPIIAEVQVKEYPKNESLLRDTRYTTLKKLLISDNIQERYWINQCLEELRNYDLYNEEYLDRLETEADVVYTLSEKLHDCLFKYFITFQHYIDLFWACGSIVGPGRGSSVCFLSNYLLGITQIDPIKRKLHYWRFLNKERVELPDIDIDLSPSRRPLILDKIREERGELNVAQVTAFGTETSRSAIITSARGLGIDTDEAHYVSSLVPSERGFIWSLDEMFNGNPKKGRKPQQTFIEEVSHYPKWKELMLKIEGIVSRRGEHASGVILYNNSPYETGALMRSKKGNIVTQFSLEDAEYLGDTKFDFLLTEICDKLIVAVNLLQNDGYFNKEDSLREIYNKYLHPSVIDLDNSDLWDALSNGEVQDVFQFSSEVGLQGVKLVKPRNPTELTMTNALIRLMGEKGKERPLTRYVRLKNNIGLWYDEMDKVGLAKEEQHILEPYYLDSCGVPCAQEDLMMVCMEPKIANFSLSDANAARKIVAKKKMDQIPILKEKFISSCKSELLGNYVWNTVMQPQMGYAFSTPHALAYSFVAIQTLLLGTQYPSVYWNCACLIVNSGSIEGGRKDKTANYGKIASAIGKMKNEGIEVSLPNINKSTYTFSPDAENDLVRYGMNGISRVGSDIVEEIIVNRPYDSLDDLLSRIKLNKLQVVSLIKAGMFDDIGDRIDIMRQYIEGVYDKKKRITLQNMNMLIERGLLPEELDQQRRIFLFNKALKKSNYVLDAAKLNFINELNLVDLTSINDKQQTSIGEESWKAYYSKAMNPVRVWMKQNQQDILDELNNTLFNEMWEKYALGSLSKWEMDSVSFYHHEHELINMNNEKYHVSNFFTLPLEPKISHRINIKGKSIPILEINRIAGTVIDKDKNRGTVQLLTPNGVVSVKMYGPIFAYHDKQLSEKDDSTGKKKVIEKSMFSRGNKIIVTGIRRGDNFIVKKYKNTPWHLIEKIDSINEDGICVVSARSDDE